MQINLILSLLVILDTALVPKRYSLENLVFSVFFWSWLVHQKIVCVGLRVDLVGIVVSSLELESGLSVHQIVQLIL